MIPVLLAALSAFFLPSAVVPAQTGTIYEQVIPPGSNFDKAAFKMWMPPGVESVRGIVVLVPGSNGDGRPMADDKFWQDFAVTQKVALVACQFTDKPHDQGFIEEYVNVAKGSGQALIDVIDKFGAASRHPELSRSPLFLWGMSAGGQFNYEFVSWKPERVGAFIVNKGGIYYTALAPKASRAVPGILFAGGTDLDSRVFMIQGLFGLNRRAGALWALAVEPGLGHVVGHSKELGALLFEEVLNAVPGAVAEKNGFLGDIHNFNYKPASEPAVTKDVQSWLATERLAAAWKAVVSEQKK